MPYGLQEQALVGLARHDGRTFAPTFQYAVPVVQSQLPFRLARTVMALIAMFHQHGSNLRFEKIDAFICKEADG